MASELENLIATNRAAANAATESAVLAQNQAMESGLGNLTTEQAEINPAYDQLLRDTKKGYETTLGQTRSSAAGRGAYWGSGGLTNQELKLGQSFREKSTDIGAERTRKLADIARRRSLLSKQTADSINAIRAKGGADLESLIADLRYKEYQTRQAQEFEMRKMRESAALSSSGSARSYSVGGKTYNYTPSGQKAMTRADYTDLISRLRDTGDPALGDRGYGAMAQYLYNQGVNISRNTPADRALRDVFGFNGDTN